MATAMANQMAGFNSGGGTRANVFKKAGDWFEKNVTKPIVQGADKYIGQPITQATKSVKRATGLEATPIPDSVKPQVDPSRAGAMAKYGTMVQTQAGQYNPAAYGPNYYQPQTYVPQVTQNKVQMPGVASPQTRAPSAPQQIAAPQQQTVSGQNLQLRDVSTGTGVYTAPERRVISEEMARLGTPTDIQAGYDSGLRDSYVGLATSGLEQQKAKAMAQLKEQQMKAGNFGSSVGQRAMTELQQNYDRQAIEAGQRADFMQMEAEREDRFKMPGIEAQRIGLRTGLAGQGAGIEFSEAGYKRDTARFQNQTEMLKAEYERQGIQIDNDTAMRLIEFENQQGQQGFSNRMAGAEFDRAGDRAAEESEWKRYIIGLDEAERADAVANQAQIFNIGQKETADVRNYGAYQDVLTGLSSYGSDQIDPQSRLDYELYMQQQADQSNRLGRTIQTGMDIYNMIGNQKTPSRVNTGGGTSIGVSGNQPAFQMRF